MDRLKGKRAMLMTMRALVVLIGLSSYSVVMDAAEPAAILGALEENPGHDSGEPNHRGVRVLFQKIGSDWQAFPSSCSDADCLKRIASEYPRVVAWTITFSGRSLGRVMGRTPNEFKLYADVGLEEITSEGPVPTIGERAKEYGGFSGSPVFRPLIANSRPFFRDPDSWKRFNPSAKIAAALRLEFRKKFPSVSNCASLEDDTAKPWPYRDADIKIIKSYRSNRDWSAVQLLLTGNRCDGPPEDAFLDQWFAVAPGGEIRFLGEGMWLVDAGDYDNDGRSEMVFSIDRYDRGGYELFYDDFKRHAEFAFSYH